MNTAQSPDAVKIVPLDDQNRSLWDGFVEKNGETTFFHKAGWRDVISGAYGHRCYHRMAVSGDEVTGIVPLVHVKSPIFGSSLVSTGFCVQGGIAADDAASRSALAEEAATLGRSLNVDFVELRSETADIPEWKTKSEVYATFRRELPEDEADNLKAIPRKKRADVRKGIKGKLEVDTSPDPTVFYRLYSESLRNLGTPVFPKRFVKELLKAFPDNTEISVVHNGKEPLSALLSFYFKDQVLPYYGGAVPAARPWHAYDYMYWTLMRRAVERGARIFDFGRSKYGTGAFDYKTYWGFEPTPLNYQYYLVKATDVPNINPLNPKYRLMVNTWRKLPVAVANMIGPFAARQLG